MNIYFACSITGGRSLEPVYQSIVQALVADGHTVPTAHLADSNVKAYEGSVLPEEIFTRDTNWICGCDTLVAEVSTPSHGVGYEIGFALGQGKPVFCIHQAGVAVSKMLTGNPDDKLQVRAYANTQEAIRLIRSFLFDVQTNL
jgi:2'-deoxynucleoside 5'-phosphate N-hydrolase